MVSSSLDMTEADLLSVLTRLRAQFSEDPEYQSLRGSLPTDWPL